MLGPEVPIPVLHLYVCVFTDTSLSLKLRATWPETAQQTPVDLHQTEKKTLKQQLGLFTGASDNANNKRAIKS